MKKTTGCFVSAFIAAIFFISGCTQKTEKKVYHVGLLSGIDYFGATIDGFIEKMTDLGYVENRDIIYDIKRMNFNPETENKILTGWISDRVDLILTSPTEVSLMAKSVAKGSDIPVLFANSFIEGFDLVENVRNPGNNLTGVRYPGPDIAVKSLETLLEIAPDAKRIWLPYLDNSPTAPGQLEALREAASIIGITLIEFPVAGSDEIKKELDRRSRLDDCGIDAVMHIADPVATWSTVADMISEFITEYKLPYHGTRGKCVFILTVDPFDVGRQAALLADKILKGGIPAGSIPVTSADPFLTINYKVANELGLEVPEGLLVRADNIIR